MDELEVFSQLNEIADQPLLASVFGDDYEMSQKIAAHRAWLRSIRRERPEPSRHYRIGIYIRYHNQTKYDNYLSYHKKQFRDTIALCPKWELIDFYIDKGSTAPNMENAPEWSRAVQDGFSGKIDLIITQKVSNVSRKPHEVAFLSSLLASLKNAVGIYFISEDLYTLASYYQEDMRSPFFLPGPGIAPLPAAFDEDESEYDRF